MQTKIEREENPAKKMLFLKEIEENEEATFDVIAEED